jgi:uncharacterized coiled-coil DUF342 family protein
MYIDRMAKQLKGVSAKIDGLEVKVRDAAADLKAGLENKIVELRSKSEELTRRIRDLRESSDVAWEALKDGVEFAWHDVKDAVSEARGKFKKAA